MNHSRTIVPALLASIALFACSPSTKPADSVSGSKPAVSATSQAQPDAPKPLDYKALEAPLLSSHLQLTSRDKFVKAGEAYFDHNSPPRWVIFQAIAVPQSGHEADPFYAMYVARLRYDKSGICGLDAAVKISPESSANTCGWFDPVDKAHVIFGSTLTRPGNTQRPGFQVGTRNYIWMFPHEMDVVSRTVPEIFRDVQSGAPEPRWSGDALSAKPVFTLPNYDAECSFSKDGKFILYSHVRAEPTRGKDDADIWIYNTQTGEHRELVHADGYDGGPFFSPDNKRICYRSDRVGNDLLQLFIADLIFDSNGMPSGISHEYQVTQNEHVNWAPFWHPSGKFLVYGTSEMGHANYECFVVEAPGPSDSSKQLRHRRITYANGADVLPVFSDDGKYMMWTAQRGPLAEGETKPSSQVWVAKFGGPPSSSEDTDLFYLPRFDPPTTDAEAIAIARRAVQINDTWSDSARYDITDKSNADGWHVTATRLPETPGGFRGIHIRRDGTIAQYLRGH